MGLLSCPWCVVQDICWTPGWWSKFDENGRAIGHPETHLTLADACLGRKLIYSPKTCHLCLTDIQLSSYQLHLPIYFICLLLDMLNMVVEVISVQFSHLPIFQIKIFASQMEETI